MSFATKLPLVTIDGPAGVGKTTIARRLAEELGLPYLDTGAMFRTIAHELGESAATAGASELEMACKDLNFTLKGAGSETTLYCRGKPVGDEIRTEATGMLASTIAQNPDLRALLATIQRRMGEQVSLVAEGRDMGTVIFPNAAFKFFLDAAPSIRAQRRLLDPKSRDKGVSLEALTEQIAQRDLQDRTRAVAPLQPAMDALLIDTGSRTIEEVAGLILSHIDSCNGRSLFVS